MPAPEGKHAHREAFCLMQYEADDGSESEVIWNSRDGVTPFSVSLRSGKPAKHVNWGSDLYAPNWKPKPGDRIFVDLTPERARVIARRNAERYAQQTPDLVEDQGGVDVVARLLEAGYLDQPGAPDLIEVIP